MNKKEEVLKKLINKQLEPYNVTYEDVLNDSEWFLKYSTTQEQEEEFKKWGIDILKKELKMTKNEAEKEMDMFLLKYGLTIKEK